MIAAIHPRKSTAGLVLACVLALTGCQLYWRKPGADAGTFAADHRDCVGKAGIDVGGDRVLVNLDVYRACLPVHGWQRESASGAGGGSSEASRTRGRLHAPRSLRRSSAPR